MSVHGDKVTLTDKIHSYAELEDARLAAWMALGVMTVESNLILEQ